MMIKRIFFAALLITAVAAVSCAGAGDGAGTAPADTTAAETETGPETAPEPPPGVSHYVKVDYNSINADYSESEKLGLIEVGVSLPDGFAENAGFFYPANISADKTASKLRTAVVEGVWQYAGGGFTETADFGAFLTGKAFDLLRNAAAEVVFSDSRPGPGSTVNAVYVYRVDGDPAYYYAYALHAETGKNLISYIRYMNFENTEALQEDVIELMFETAGGLYILSDPKIAVDVIDDIEKWEDLGLYKTDIRYEYIKAFLDGNKAKFEELSDAKGLYTNIETLIIGGYQIKKIEKKRIYDGEEYSEQKILFTLDVTGSGFVPIGAGQHSYYINEGIPCMYFSASGSETAETEAQAALSRLLNITMEYDIRDMQLTEYIITALRSIDPAESVKAADITEYAEKYFSVGNFMPDKRYEATLPDGTAVYEIPGHGGTHIIFSHAGEKPDGDDMILTVQFYADMSKLIKSHTVEYRMRKTDGIWAFSGSEITFKAQHEPYRYMV